MRIIIAFAGIALIAAGCSFLQASEGEVLTKTATVIIRDHAVRAEVADTETAREEGLKNRKSLPANTGMLFIFNRKDYHAFWMKDTLIPLDMIWINDDTIVHIEEHVQPSEKSLPPLYRPIAPANYVLEVNSGMVEEGDIRVGDEVQIEIRPY